MLQLQPTFTAGAPLEPGRTPNPSHRHEAVFASSMEAAQDSDAAWAKHHHQNGDLSAAQFYADRAGQPLSELVERYDNASDNAATKILPPVEDRLQPISTPYPASLSQAPSALKILAGVTTGLVAGNGMWAILPRGARRWIYNLGTEKDKDGNPIKRKQNAVEHAALTRAALSAASVGIGLTAAVVVPEYLRHINKIVNGRGEVVGYNVDTTSYKISNFINEHSGNVLAGLFANAIHSLGDYALPRDPNAKWSAFLRRITKMTPPWKGTKQADGTHKFTEGVTDGYNWDPLLGEDLVPDVNNVAQFWNEKEGRAENPDGKPIPDFKPRTEQPITSRGVSGVGNASSSLDLWRDAPPPPLSVPVASAASMPAPKPAPQVNAPQQPMTRSAPTGQRRMMAF